MRPAPSLLALLAALAATGAAAGPERDAHRHPGLLFELRVDTAMSDAFVYRAFLTDPAHPADLIVERGNGNLGDEAIVDLRPSSCPAAAAVVMRLGSLNLPAVALAPPAPPGRSAPRAPRPESYFFSGFVHFPNGAEGEANFYAYGTPGQPAYSLGGWANALVRAVDGCRRRSRTP